MNMTPRPGAENPSLSSAPSSAASSEPTSATSPAPPPEPHLPSLRGDAPGAKADASAPDGDGRTTWTALSRPIAAAAILAALGAAVLVVQALSPAAREIGSGLVTYLLLAAAVESACAIGFRLNRRWALVAYMSYFPLHQLILAAVATWSPFGFLLRMTVVILGFTRLSRLR